MAARWSGKVKAAAQGLSQLSITFLFAVYAGAPPESLIFFGWLLLFVTTALSVWSFFDYVWLIYSARTERKAVQFSKQP
jgi:phosphatidylglycerophosphate synthase